MKPGEISRTAPPIDAAWWCDNSLYVTPAPVRTFISDFDFTAAGTPFEFELDAPTSILELNQSNEWMQRKEPTWIA